MNALKKFSKCMSTHRAVAEVIATFLLVAIAVVGGTIIFVFSQESFNKTQLSGIVIIDEIMEMMPGETYYTILAVMPDEIKDSVQTRLGSDAYVGSFRVSALNKFPNNQIMLLGYSNQTTLQAIIDAKANGFSAVAYDNEKSNAGGSTPPEELEKGKPALFTNYLAIQVQNAGLKYVVAPTKRLLEEEYLGVNWNNVDILIMQLQRSPDVATFVERATRIGNFVHDQNPNVIVLAQVNGAETFQTMAEIKDELSQLRNVIDGVSIICGQCTDAQFNELIDTVETALG